jgi:Fic family protein
LPVKYCTNNKFIRSHLNALDEAVRYSSVDSVKKICDIHEKMGTDVLERGEAGMLRNYKHFARSTGHLYSHPNDILNDLSAWCEKTKDKDPFLRHIEYECIHPFNDGNGRSGRIILAADLNFDFKLLNDLIGRDYISKIIMHQDNISIEKVN